MAEKISFNTKELAELLDVGETKLQNQVIPVIKAIMAESLDETFRTFVNQRERIELLEEENRLLHRRLETLEGKIFSPILNESPDAIPSDEGDWVALESDIGIELDTEPG